MKVIIHEEVNILINDIFATGLLVCKAFNNGVEIVFGYKDFECKEEGQDFFTVLQELRKKLERVKIFIGINGARKDFYPSNMARQMSLGQVGYILTIGERALIKGRTFDQCIDWSLIGTVEEQETYYNDWLKSLNGNNYGASNS